MFCSKQAMLGTSKNISGFDPRSIPGCSLWLDGSDSSRMTFSSGSNISNISDKSGNGYVGTTFSNAVAAPTYTGSVALVAGNGFSVPNFVITPTMTVFYVGYASTGSNIPPVEHGSNVETTPGFLIQTAVYNYSIQMSNVGSLISTALSYLPLATNSTDSGTLPQTVTTNGTVTYTTIGSKQCAYFNNSTANYLSFPYTNQTTFTLSFWLYPIDTGYYTSVSITTSGNSPALQTDIIGSSTTIYTAMPNQWTNQPSGTTSGAGAWTHFAITINQTTYVEQLYLNGSLASTVTGSGSSISSRNLFILGKSGDSMRAFNGYIRQFLFFNSVLSSSQVSTLYTSTA